MKQRVLILCTANSARSHIAEGLLRHLGGENYEVCSAGTHPSVVNPLAIEIMREAGMDISGHQSKAVSEFAGRKFDVVITVCDSAAEVCPIFPGAPLRIHWSLPDPAAVGGMQEERLAAFRAVRDDLTRLLREFLSAGSAASR
jgi:arsenate reductase